MSSYEKIAEGFYSIVKKSNCTQTEKLKSFEDTDIESILEEKGVEVDLESLLEIK